MDPRMAGTNHHATRWNRRTRTVFEESTTGTTQNTPRRRHAATATANPRGLTGTKFTTIKGAASSRTLARLVQELTGIRRDQLESTWVFTY
jgi:hypothetical protein